MPTVRFVNDEPVGIKLTTLDSGQMAMPDGDPVGAFITTYMSVGGPKAKMMVWVEDEELGGFYDNWNTWYPSKDADGAWRDALSWAHAEDIPAIRGI